MENVYKTSDENVFVVVRSETSKCNLDVNDPSKYEVRESFRWFPLDADGCAIVESSKSGVYKSERTALTYAGRVLGVDSLELVATCEDYRAKVEVRRVTRPASEPDRYTVVGPDYVRVHFDNIDDAFDYYESISLRKCGKSVCDKRLMFEQYDGKYLDFFHTVIASEKYSSEELGVRW